MDRVFDFDPFEQQMAGVGDEAGDRSQHPLAGVDQVRQCVLHSPASNRAIATCVCAGVATTTTSGRAASADSRSVDAREIEYRSATARRRSAKLSQIDKSARPVAKKQRAWRSPIDPTPTTKTRCLF